MFELSKQMLEDIKKAFEPTWQPAMEGPQILYITCGCCQATCKGTCRNMCTQVGKGRKR